MGCVVRHDYVNEYVWGKPKANRARKLWASVICDHGPSRFTATLVVRDRDSNMIASALVVDESPSEFEFADKLGRLFWASNNVVELRDRSGATVNALRVSAD